MALLYGSGGIKVLDSLSVGETDFLYWVCLDECFIGAHLFY